MTSVPAAHAAFARDQTIRPGRRPTTKLETTTMYATHTPIAFEMAVRRQEDLLHQVEQRRLIDEAVAGRQTGSVQALRRFAGSLIVRAGQRVQGQERRQAAGAPTPGILRMAR